LRRASPAQVWVFRRRTRRLIWLFIAAVAAMIAAINRGKFSVPVAVDVSALANAQSGSLMAPPMLRYLVEAK
jgi:hypothetical protein